jgi:hypothetical protein
MSRLSIPRKNQPPTKSYRRDVGAPQKEWPSFVKSSPNPHLLTIVAWCLIVLLVALNLIFLFPDFGAVIEHTTSSDSRSLGRFRQNASAHIAMKAMAKLRLRND